MCHLSRERTVDAKIDKYLIFIITRGTNHLSEYGALYYNVSELYIIDNNK